MEFTDEKIIILNDANLKLHIPIDNNSEKSKNIILYVKINMIIL